MGDFSSHGVDVGVLSSSHGVVVLVGLPFVVVQGDSLGVDGGGGGCWGDFPPGGGGPTLVPQCVTCGPALVTVMVMVLVTVHVGRAARTVLVTVHVGVIVSVSVASKCEKQT